MYKNLPTDLHAHDVQVCLESLVRFCPMSSATNGSEVNFLTSFIIILQAANN